MFFRVSQIGVMSLRVRVSKCSVSSVPSGLLFRLTLELGFVYFRFRAWVGFKAFRAQGSRQGGGRPGGRVRKRSLRF